MAHKRRLTFKDVTLQSMAIIFLVISYGKSQKHDGAAHKEIHSESGNTKIREGFSISPKNCNVAGEEGTCMFVWECLKSEGKHLGMCMDGFMFGSCCVHGNQEETTESIKVSSSNSTNLPPFVNELESDSISDNTNVDSTLLGVHSAALETIQTSENFSDIIPIKYRPDTSTEASTITFSTRQTRPTKPSIMWPSKDVITSKSSTSTTTTTTPKENMINFNPSARPTWKPVTTSFTESKWSWENKYPTIISSTTESPSSEFLYFPISDNLVDENDTFILKDPFRPTDKTVTEVLSHFPSISNMEIINTAGQIHHLVYEPYTTTSNENLVQSTQESMSIVKATPRPPFHVMTPPNLSTSTSSTPHPPAASPIHAPQAGSCGTPVLKKQCPKGRIVNGTQSCYGQFPWQVSVRRTSFFGFSSTHRCGGVLINDNWVATAGHCVDDLSVPKIRLRIGEWDFSSTSEPQSHVELMVVNKIVHPNYNFFTYEFDLALLKLESKVTFQENIIPICLPGNDDSLVGETGIVAGWGRLSEGGQLPNILQYVSVPIVSNTKCKNMFLKANRHEVIPDIFMCAGFDNGGRDSCQGDSGGPLVVKGVDGRFFLGGIISWGIGCAEPNLPGVCTRISKFTDWILEQIS